MTKKVRRRPRKRKETVDCSQKQTTMDGKLIKIPSIAHQKTGLKYLVESFTLCSVDREVSKKGKGKRPDPRYRRAIAEKVQDDIQKVTGRKVIDPDLSLMGTYFEKYVGLVNLVLERVYSDKERVDILGEELNSYRGQGYTLIKKEQYLSYKDNKDIQAQCFERMYRNVLEQAARIIQSNWLRRQLMRSAIEYVIEDRNALIGLLKNKFVSSKMIKEVRAQCESTKNNGTGYYYTVSVLKQLRKKLDEHILREREEPLGFRGYQRKRVSQYLKDKIESIGVLASVDVLLQEFESDGYPFSIPKMQSHTEDFSASTENSPGQGYWYSLDKEKDNEVLFFLKLPEPIEGKETEGSPFSTKTLSFRFLDWLPRAVAKDRAKAVVAERKGKYHRAKKLNFRARKFEDMHQQLINTIELQHATYQYTRLKSRKEKDVDKVKELQEKITHLRKTRKCGPPRLLLRDSRVTLQIPFLPPTKEMIDEELGSRTYRRKAGADRGVRVPIVLSTRDGNGGFVDEMISFDELISKRDFLRDQTRPLTSRVKRLKNNWERKHTVGSFPSHILKKDRHLSAIWRKVRRLDREIARQVASQTVWFCEEYGVKTLYFENLKNYSAPAGWGTLSWRLSSNLWSMVLDTVTYMRQSLGHTKGGVWTVSPAWTSQKCHVCGEKGVRVESKGSTEEKKGGEYFHCESCGCSLHADVNAARNIIDVQSSRPSAVAGQQQTLA
ncbi:MAG: zinc ribbon domain-containing protein [Candidatus Thorarchaeota archaeon]